MSTEEEIESPFKCSKCSSIWTNNGCMVELDNKKYCIGCWNFEIRFGELMNKGFRTL